MILGLLCRDAVERFYTIKSVLGTRNASSYENNLMSNPEIELSIVTSLYKSEAYVEEFCARMAEVAARLTKRFEIILVNDGSPDASLAKALALHQKDSRITIVDLSRNFGHHPALFAGMSHSRGGMVYLTDSDLEEPPELLESFHGRIKQGDCDVVYGYQGARKGGIVERVTGDVFYRLFNFLSDVQLPRNLVTARLMTRRYVDSLLLHRDRSPFLAGLLAITGYVQCGVPVKKGSNPDSSYCWRRRWAQAFDSITAFSSKPLLLSAYLGTSISAGALLYIAYLIVRWLARGIPVEGWTSLIVSIWFLGGLNLLFLGVVGLYLSRVFMEIKDRPTTVVRALYRR
jgi:putative glycosyltransferase